MPDALRLEGHLRVRQDVAIPVASLTPARTDHDPSKDIVMLDNLKNGLVHHAAAPSRVLKQHETATPADGRDGPDTATSARAPGHE